MHGSFDVKAACTCLIVKVTDMDVNTCTINKSAVSRNHMAAMGKICEGKHVPFATNTPYAGLVVRDII